jgi:uncharacterized membrane protein HdeD (DUF308 family)
MRVSTILFVLGAFFVLGGILALANPFAASLTVTVLTGAVFLVGGVLQTWFAFSDQTMPHRVWNGFIGLVGILAGVSLLANPLGGVLSLTLLLAILFVMTGVARIAGAIALRGNVLFWPLLLSGVASVVLGGLILTMFPDAASNVLGLLLGLELVAEGVALVILGIAARKLA